MTKEYHELLMSQDKETLIQWLENYRWGTFRISTVLEKLTGCPSFALAPEEGDNYLCEYCHIKNPDLYKKCFDMTNGHEFEIKEKENGN